MANATRAGPVSHAPTPPMLPSVYAIAASGASQASPPNARAPTSIPCRKPDTMLTLSFGTSRSSAPVPSTYAAAMSGAEMRIARGSVRRGLRTSPPIALDSSSPATAHERGAEHDEYDAGNVRADPTGVLQPLPRPDADDVQQHSEPEADERRR